MRKEAQQVLWPLVALQTASSSPMPAWEGGIPRREGGSLRREGDIPRREGNIPRREGDIPRREGDIPRTKGDIPRREGDIPRREGDIPRREKDIPRREEGRHMREEGSHPVSAWEGSSLLPPSPSMGFTQEERTRVQVGCSTAVGTTFLVTAILSSFDQRLLELDQSIVISFNDLEQEVAEKVGDSLKSWYLL